MKPVARGVTPWAFWGSLGGLVGCLILSSGCEREVSKQAATPEREPFEFSLPPEFAPLPLRGVGSEFLSAPRGASVERSGQQFRVTGGESFDVIVTLPGQSLPNVRKRLDGEQPLLESGDLLVVQGKPGEFAFVVASQLIPEWDESDIRPFTCESAGFGARAERRHFTQEAVEAMVAACRSVSLPRLE